MAKSRQEQKEAAEYLGKPIREFLPGHDDAQAEGITTISVNGGPQVSLETVKKALELIGQPSTQRIIRQCKEEARRALEAVYGDVPVPEHEIQSVAANVYKRLIGEDMPTEPVKVGGIDSPKLKSYIERIERLKTDQADIGDDIKDVFREAKSNGFCTKTIRELLKIRNMKASDRIEQKYMLELYSRALGMQQEFDFEAQA